MWSFSYILDGKIIVYCFSVIKHKITLFWVHFYVPKISISMSNRPTCKSTPDDTCDQIFFLMAQIWQQIYFALNCFYTKSTRNKETSYISLIIMNKLTHTLLGMSVHHLKTFVNTINIRQNDAHKEGKKHKLVILVPNTLLPCCKWTIISWYYCLDVAMFH